MLPDPVTPRPGRARFLCISSEFLAPFTFGLEHSYRSGRVGREPRKTATPRSHQAVGSQETTPKPSLAAGPDQVLAEVVDVAVLAPRSAGPSLRGFRLDDTVGRRGLHHSRHPQSGLSEQLAVFGCGAFAAASEERHLQIRPLAGEIAVMVG